jgi:hypothetical protein
MYNPKNKEIIMKKLKYVIPALTLTFCLHSNVFADKNSFVSGVPTPPPPPSNDFVSGVTTPEGFVSGVPTPPSNEIPLSNKISHKNIIVPADHPVKKHPADHNLGENVKEAAEKVREAARRTTIHKKLKKATQNLHKRIIFLTKFLSSNKNVEKIMNMESKSPKNLSQAEKTLLTNLKALINSLKIYEKNIKINIGILRTHIKKVKKMEKTRRSRGFVGGDPRTWAPSN